MDYSKTNFGELEFEGKVYELTDQAECTSRLLPGGYTNYIDAEEGEEYDFEMSCSAKDKQGNEYMVYWIFQDIKGEGKELDSFDYDNVDRVEVI